LPFFSSGKSAEIVAMANEDSGKIADGPINAVVDGIAGKIGGWWRGRAASDARERYGAEEDSYYRDRYEGSPHQLADRRFEHIRPAYQLGHLARLNPDYQGRDFDSIEQEIKAGWVEQISSRHGEWVQVREYAREAYTQDFSVAAREAALRDRSTSGSVDDRLTNAHRPPTGRIAGAIDDRNGKGDDGNAEARLTLPVSRR